MSLQKKDMIIEKCQKAKFPGIKWAQNQNFVTIKVDVSDINVVLFEILNSNELCLHGKVGEEEFGMNL